MTYILLAIILLSYSGIPTIYYRIKFFCKSKLYNNSNKIAKKLLKRTKVNHLICLHDGRGRNKAPLRTIRALEKTIPLWIEEGYTFVKIDDLIKTTITSN